MRTAFSLFEILVVLSLVSILAFFAFPKTNATLNVAANSLLEHLSYARHLALNDNLIYTDLEQTKSLKNRFKSIDEHGLIQKNPMWQIQFHMKGEYAFTSYSIYVDTPRFAPTTNYDGRPMDGDIIAIGGNDRKCLSGYNNTNIAQACKNNSSVFIRLAEAYGLQDLHIESDKGCEGKRLNRIYFDRFGLPHCGKERVRLEHSVKIVLEKHGKKRAICILPSGYAFLLAKGNVRGNNCEEKSSYSL
ncbi:prepilin-type N-terminal cleavage/methylation domain-containing protein [Helicobacter sp. 11S02596-1]|uniref:pilus assembly FimT family protein n=1 Tax=Helicobacter sp. 11S02596-1 TaxID=1476194 RepID=UPI000BA7182E|nr:prepilin-type N-terminal cleavage/methylation domain-containing protein [Helicobacter sp. 11S02596-1]PAF44819.1 hypothetical protein BJI48_02190 [Helicobacter sp. 11S02596-1]